MNRTIGIDPGAKGGIALLVNGDLHSIADMPMTNGRVDLGRFDQYLTDMVGRAGDADEDVVVVIERQQFMPSEYGQFTKGINFGVLLGLVFPRPVVEVRPQDWKKHHGLIKKPKDEARVVAIDLWPRASGLLARKKDVDRADAALIGRWWWDTQR